MWKRSKVILRACANVSSAFLRHSQRFSALPRLNWTKHICKSGSVQWLRYFQIWTACGYSKHSEFPKNNLQSIVISTTTKIPIWMRDGNMAGRHKYAIVVSVHSRVSFNCFHIGPKCIKSGGIRNGFNNTRVECDFARDIREIAPAWNAPEGKMNVLSDTFCPWKKKEDVGEKIKKRVWKHGLAGRLSSLLRS